MSLELELRLLAVALAVYALGSIAVSLAVAASWSGLLRSAAKTRIGARRPRALAELLLVLRALPVAVGAVLAVSAVSAFVVFEPNRGSEEVGTPLLAWSLAGAALVVLALARGGSAARASARLARGWRVESPPAGECPLEAHATDVHAVELHRVDATFPVVALAGWLRPRLYLSTRVAAACDDEELAAMVAHELAHLRARDNLCRAAFALAPDLLALLPASAAMVRAWDEAAELAADAAATGHDERRRLALASALVKVARLATTPVPPMPAAALYRGEPIADRVRRLVEPPASAALPTLAGLGVRAVVVLGVASGVLIAAVAASEPVLWEAIEAAIRFGA